MKKNILNSIAIFTLLIIATSCKTKKVIVTAPPATQTEVAATPDKKLENLNLLKSKDLQFNTLSLKGKANLDIDGDANNVSMNIRIQKDKKIWVIITAGGGLVEVARALITPDSLKLINKLQKTYTKKPFSYIQNFTNNQVNFGLLQSLLSGNVVKEFVTDKSDLKQENGVFTLSSTTNNLAYSIIFNTLFKPAEIALNDAKTGQALKATYGEYTPLNNALFPSNLKLNSMADGKRINIEIEFDKIEANVPVEFPFNVNKSFQVIN
jgi:hypothetical protein